MNALSDCAPTEDFHLIVTCRISRIENTKDLEASCWELLPFDGDKIISFVKTYGCTDKILLLSELLKNDEKLISVFGIPLLLYMVLALDVDLTSSTSLVSIYSQIFSLTSETSIYFRRRYDCQHPITAAEAKQIHEFSKCVAFTIWCNAPGKAYITMDECREILATHHVEENNVQIRDLLIGQYFIEGQNGHELYFVHRSIYEYFTALALLDAMAQVEKSGSVDLLFAIARKGTPAPALTQFTHLISANNLTIYPDIKADLRALMVQAPSLGVSYHFAPAWWQDFLDKFILNGLMFSVGGNAGVFAETMQLANLLVLVKYVHKQNGEKAPYRLFDSSVPYQFSFSPNFATQRFAKNDNAIISAIWDLSELDLSNLDFSYSCLAGANLSHTDLYGARLDFCILAYARLNHAQLKGSSLKNTFCRHADFSDTHTDSYRMSQTNTYSSQTDFRGADLSNANFSRASFDCINLSRTDLTGTDFVDSRIDRIRLDTFYDRGRAYTLNDFKNRWGCYMKDDKPEDS